MPANVADAVRRRWPNGGAWSRDVEVELNSLCERFSAKPIEIFDARYGFVVAAQAPGRRQLVLRASADPDAIHEASVSRALARLGVGPAIHEVTQTPTGVWTVMDRVVPGTPLADVRSGPWTLPALVALFRPMLDEPAPADDLPCVTRWLRQRLLNDSLRDLAPGRKIATSTERQDALSILDDLGDTLGLCHADASTWNVLLDGRDSFRLIDPRGMSGDASYDLAVVALKAGKYAPPHLVVDTFARHLGVEHDRLDAWMVVADAARV